MAMAHNTDTMPVHSRRLLDVLLRRVCRCPIPLAGNAGYLNLQLLPDTNGTSGPCGAYYSPEAPLTVTLGAAPAGAVAAPPPPPRPAASSGSLPPPPPPATSG